MFPFFSNGSDAFYLAEDGEHNLEGLNCELIWTNELRTVILWAQWGASYWVLLSTEATKGFNCKDHVAKEWAISWV